jgi:L,D-peptidoglycan transpeptidase YkuD (ErfK/YbiS/YcfS/YnhG family)
MLFMRLCFFRLFLPLLFGGWGLAGTHAAPTPGLDPGVRQLLISIAPGWGSAKGTLVALERQADGRWQRALGPWPALYGKNGLVWGRGVLGTDEPGAHKVERDAKAPAGVFQIGKIYTYDAALPPGARYPFRTVTAADAWVDDPALPALYNRHLVVDLQNPPPWFEKQKMRHGDPAYRWLVEIRHNADDILPGAGSAIFFHVRRGPERPTWGCTTLAAEHLVALICWLRAEARPHYVLLPSAEYLKKWRAWGLPSPEEIADKF